VIYDPIAPVHVSGHASQEEQKLLIHLVKPKHFIPIHGELRHLHQHAANAREVGIPNDRIAVIENGTVIDFKDGEMHVGDRIPGGYVFVDGSGVGDIGPSVMREREALAENGVVVVDLRLDGMGGLVSIPELTTKGFVFVRDSEEMLGGARAQVGPGPRCRPLCSSTRAPSARSSRTKSAWRWPITSTPRPNAARRSSRW